MHCLLCKRPLLDCLGDNPSFPESRIYQCHQCQFAQTVPLPTPDKLLAFYQAGYYIKDEKLTGLESRLRFSQQRADSQFQFMHKFFSKTEHEHLKALELGCSEGSLLLLLEKFGFDIVAYEPDTKMAELANNRLGNKNKVINQMFKEDNLGHEQYDLICSSHVFEHLANPVAHFMAVKKALKKEGLLFMEIPNDIRLEAMIELTSQKNGHLYFYSPKSIQKFLTENGFKILSLKTCGKNVVELKSQKNKKDLNSLEYKIVLFFSYFLKKVAQKLNIHRYNSVDKILAFFPHQKSQNDPFMTYWAGHMQGQWIRLIATKK